MTTLTSINSDLIFEKCSRIDAFEKVNPHEILSVSEWKEYHHWKADSRKSQWLAGRHLSKSLIQEYAIKESIPFKQIEILSRNQLGQSVCPEIFINGQKMDWSLSISHTESLVWGVLSLNNDSRIGIDLISESIPENRHLLKWFTNRETTDLSNNSFQEIAQHWALKESIYKATNTGESFFPLKIEIIKSTEGSVEYIVNGKNLTNRCHVQNKQFQNHSGILIEIQNK